ncbi:MAG: hypothetical protein Q8877_02980 [Sweet potato little leaf phytoplasma]|nr:hypothetical protein [Sweet potato little leaf phytoplasma]
MLVSTKICFTASTKDIVFHNVINQGKTLSPEQQFSLLSPVTDEEIKNAMFSIGIDKAPGPDGYGSGFFRDTWDTTGQDFCAAVREFFSSGYMLKEINTTNLVMIPKLDTPSSVHQFRPIA